MQSPGPTSRPAVAVSAPVADPVFTPDGIDAGRTGQEIDFNRAESGAIAAMTKLMGQPPTKVSQACPGLRAARWTDGTTLFFAPKPYDPPSFVGWQTATGRAGQTCPNLT